MNFNTTFIHIEEIITESYDLTQNVSAEELERLESIMIINEYMKKDHTFGIITESALKCLYILLMMSGLLTNIFIICVIATNKQLLTSNNLLLINLFVSDILLCIFCMPFTLVALIRRSWTFGQFLCKLVPFIQAVTTFVSAATITSIALDRMKQITSNRLTGRSFRSQPFSGSAELIKYGYNTAIIWLISVLLSAPICIYQKVVDFGIKDLVLYQKCVEDWPYNNRGIYSFVILITQLLIPSSVMLFSHYRIKVHLNKFQISKSPRNLIRVKDGEEAQTSGQSSIGSDNGVTNNSIEASQRETVLIEESVTKTSTAVNCFLKPVSEPNYFNKELNRNNHVTIFLLTVTIIYGISWLPWNLFNVYVDFYPNIDLTPRELYLILAVCHLIAMSSATSNAIFYGFLHTGIRKELRTTISKMKQCFR